MPVMLMLIDHAPICSWNQPVLSNEFKVYCSRKQQEPFMGFELASTTDYKSDASTTVHPYISIMYIVLNILFS